MTPEQITEALDEIISNIADAHILIHRLQQNFDLARRKTLAVSMLSTRTSTRTWGLEMRGRRFAGWKSGLWIVKARICANTSSVCGQVQHDTAIRRRHSWAPH